MGKISVTCLTGLPRTHLPAPHALLRGCGVASRPACPPAGDRDDLTVLVRAFLAGNRRVAENQPSEWDKKFEGIKLLFLERSGTACASGGWALCAYPNPD